MTAAPSTHAFISADAVAAPLKFVAPAWAAVLVPLPPDAPEVGEEAVGDTVGTELY